MSEKEVKTAKKKSFSKILKWILLVVFVIGLELGTIAASVFLTESRANNNVVQQKNARSQLSEQSKRLRALENLSPSVSNNAQNIIALSRTLNTLSDNLTALQNEVGNNKLDKLSQNIDSLAKQIESLKETRNNEVLILSAALIIKENVLYHRSFIKEINVLSALAQNNANIKDDLAIIKSYEHKDIPDNVQLSREFNQIIHDFTFVQQDNVESDNTSKSLKLLKDTMANINLDKVMVLKKEKKTHHQKELLKTLSSYVNAYDFASALAFIQSNSEFVAANNEALNTWISTVESKLVFEKALANIISEQLSVLREEFAENIVVSKVQNNPITEEKSEPLLTEDVAND